MIQAELFDQGDAGEDEDRLHHERSEDAPEQHAVLVYIFGTRKKLMMMAHDEDVVGR